MIIDITKNDLILLAYNELPDNDRVSILNAVMNDNELLDEFRAILNQMKELDGALTSPNPTSVEIILEEACSSSSLEVI